MIQMSENFRLWASQPLDERLVYDSIADMAAVDDYKLYDGIIAAIKGDTDKKTYQWFSSNEVDTTLGKWREFNVDIKLKEDGGLKKDADGNLYVDGQGTADALVASVIKPEGGLVYVTTDIMSEQPADWEETHPGEEFVAQKVGESKELKVDTTKIATQEDLKKIKSFETEQVDSIDNLVTRDADGKINGLKQKTELVNGVETLVTDAEGNPVYVAEPNIIYFVPQATDDQEEPDFYDEYMRFGDRIEFVGTTDGGSAKLTSGLTANQTVGGIDKGAQFAKGTSLEDLVRKMLVKEIAPTFRLTPKTTAFGAVEEGTTIAAQDMTITMTYNSASAVKSVELFTGNDTDGFTSVGTATIETGKETSFVIVCPSTTVDMTVKATITYVESDGVTEKSKDVTGKYDFVYKTYYGAVASVPTTQAEIEALGASEAKSAIAGEFKYTADNQYLVMASPHTCAGFNDKATGYTLNWVASTVTCTKKKADGVTDDTIVYNVYATENPVGVSNYTVVFK